jgi:serine racemase
MSEKMKEKYPDLKNVGLIICGGNIDLDTLPWHSSSF